MVSVTSPWTPRAFPMTGVISALPVNHRVGDSLENLILKIRSHVNDRRCLWGKLLSSMIRYRLNVTKVNIIQWCTYKQLGSTKTKQASHILQYITHLHQHTWSLHNSYMSKMCIQNIANIFASFFNFALAEFCAKFAKINASQILPHLQYLISKMKLCIQCIKFQS